MGKHILIVDDEAPFRFSASLCLRQEGYEVSEAKDGAEAFTMIMERHHLGLAYDLIVLDINMPKISGTDLFETFRNHGITTPVVFITGYADEKALSTAYKQSKSRLLQKPIASEEMISMVALMCSGRGERELRTQVQNRGGA